MKTRIARLGAFAVFALGLVAFTGTAIADNGGGNGNAGTPPGQAKQDQTPAAPQPPGQAKQATPPAASPQPAAPAASGKSSPGHAKQAAKASTSTPGVKPSNTTHWTKCSTGGGTGTSATCTGNGPKADSSKQYGNGKTAAQIANSRGAPAGTILTGPGNSQPHKVAVCPKKNNKSGGVDVHAVKSYSTASCSKKSPSTETPTQATAPATATPATASPAGQTASAPAGGVLGAQATLTHPAKAKSAGGVLGAVARLGVAGARANLPFTGLQLWIAVLIALGLIAGGLAVRARAPAR